MRNIYFHYPHLKFFSGGTKFILLMAEGFANKSKYQVSFITNFYNPKVVKEFSKSKINFFEISNLTTNSLLYWLFFPITFSYDLIKTSRLVKKGDTLISCLFPSNAICAIISKLKVLDHYHYCFEPFPFLQNKEFIASNPPLKKLLLQFLAISYKWLDNFGVKNAQTVFTLNQITQKMIKKTYNVDSVVTLMGVDSNHFKKNSSKKFDQHKPYIAHSTDYSIFKNSDLAIHALSKLANKNIKLVVTSTRPNAPEKKDLELLVSKLKLKNRVIFLDLIDYDDLPVLYSNAICYLSCSYDEMTGTSSSNLPVKEAMACETPAIRANITTEDVENGVSGFLIDPRKTTNVAKRIDYLSKHTIERNEMGRAARKKIKILYQWDNVTNIMIKEVTKYD